MWDDPKRALWIQFNAKKCLDFCWPKNKSDPSGVMTNLSTKSGANLCSSFWDILLTNQYRFPSGRYIWSKCIGKMAIINFMLNIWAIKSFQNCLLFNATPQSGAVECIYTVCSCEPQPRPPTVTPRGVEGRALPPVIILPPLFGMSGVPVRAETEALGRTCHNKMPV